MPREAEPQAAPLRGGPATPSPQAGPTERERGKSLHAHVENVFAVDLRSMAVMRVAIALILLSDLINRARDIGFFYTDAGVLPRAALVEQFSSPWTWSLHLYNGSAIGQAVLFVVAGFAALMLLFGIRTRLATIVSWVMLVSLHHRNTMILDAGDYLFRLLIFWSIFIPWGARWSIDAAMHTMSGDGGGGAPPSNRYASAATVALLLQVCMVYWFTAALKNHPIWLEGKGILYALQCDSLVSPLGERLLSFPAMLVVMTYATLVIEAVGPLVALSPWRTGPLRFAVVVVFWMLHLGMGLTLVLGHFPFICVAAWCAFIPAWFWERMAARIDDSRRACNRIYFDGECNLCRKLVAVIRTLLLLDAAPAQAAQEASDPSILADMRQRTSWVIVDETGRRRFGFDAFVQLCRISPIAWVVAPVLSLAPMRWIGERIYKLIATDRSRAARWFAWLRPRPLKLDPPEWTGPLVVFLFIYAVLWNVRTINFDRYETIFPRSWNYIGEIAAVDQYWSMFAPYPQTDNGWYVIPAQLVDGTVVDLMTAKPVTWERPGRISAMYPNTRHRKFMMNLWPKKFADYRVHWARAMCRQWNAAHRDGKQVNTFQLICMREDSTPDARLAPPVKVLLLDHKCFGE